MHLPQFVMQLDASEGTTMGMHGPHDLANQGPFVHLQHERRNFISDFLIIGLGSILYPRFSLIRRTRQWEISHHLQPTESVKWYLFFRNK